MEPKKRSYRNAVIAFGIVAILLAAALLFIVLFSPDLHSFSPSPTPTSDPNATIKQYVAYVLSLINADRQANGLGNVTLSNVDSAQQHADDMLAKSYFSHWGLNGYKPYMRYTLAGGMGAVEENCAWEGVSGLFGIDVKSALKELELAMMNDDAASNWGHKENILNPTHNRVSIGVSYDQNRVYLVQDFEDDYVSWEQLAFINGTVTLKGTMTIQRAIQQVAIYYDNPQPLTKAQIEESPYNDGYNPGTYVGSVLPPNYQVTSGITIQASNWSQNRNSFQVSFQMDKAIATHQSGVYTLYLLTGSSTTDSLLSYSIFVE